MSLRNLFSSAGIRLPDMQPNTINVGGIVAEVWGMERLTRDPVGEVAVMFFLHGRTRDKETMHEATQYILAQLQDRKERSAIEKRTHDLLIVTLDSRNHGERVVDPNSILGWDQNPMHAVDLYAMVAGGASEVSQLVSFLPSYLFPDFRGAAGSPITTWICAGVSQGGHSTWHVGVNDRRVKFLCPIIGSPDYASLFQHRSKVAGVALVPPAWPKALELLVDESDPVNQPSTVWADKDILVLSGGRDPVVPFKEGGTEAFIERLRSDGQTRTRVNVFVDETAKHQTTIGMVNRLVEWLWDDVLPESV
ncbi:hypothetical protein PUNSTDRAFT_117940 [Punctularia strigosozonata HHB-11173 SS5]|uniref:uncharacterized protein n=1 Tax=Punctularia strigosozonata (strain HHB-11173) TaxID=741275 RepID=UPI0004417093|nr:uncharacterized protein PUNSTDRAFT_117940 [Punctularia strigosozonata HHB-11173 SS5]EIN14447.1 hypothetical protein PUNSTDRAFT_117940 [Punctularia strigosozonata HHB-11173 SS5]